MFSYESLISLFLLMPQTLERLESGLIRIYWRLSYFYVITLHCWIVLIFGSLTALLSYIFPTFCPSPSHIKWSKTGSRNWKH